MSSQEFVAKVKIEPDTSQFRGQLTSELRQESQAAERSLANQSRTTGTTSLSSRDTRSPYDGAYREAVLENSRRSLMDLKAQTLVMEAQRRATDELSGAYTRLSDRQVMVGKGGVEAERAVGGLASKAGLLGIAAVAGYQAIQQLSAALRVSGAEATSTEGKFRNLGASLLQGDVVGGFKALRVEPELAAEQMDKLVRESVRAGDQVKVDALKAAAASEGWGKLADQLDAVSDSINALNAQKSLESSLRRVDTVAAYNRVSTEEAQNLIYGERGSEYGRGPGAAAAADRFEAQDRAREAEEKAMLERKTKAETLAAARRLKDANAPRSIIDAVSTAQRTKQLQDDVAAARQEEAYFTERLLTVEEGTARYTQINQQLTQAITRRQGLEAAIEQRMQSESERKAALAKDRAAEAARLAAEREAARQRELSIARQEYRDDLGFEEALLTLTLRRASMTEDTIKDDVKAEQKLIAFYKEQSRNKRLSKEERRSYFLQFKNEQLDLKSLKDGVDGGSGGFTLDEYFKEAANQRTTFGSNVSNGDVPLSGQGARASLADIILGGGPMLTAQERANAILEEISAKLDGGVAAPAKGNRPWKSGDLKAAMSAPHSAGVYGYGAN